MENGWMQLGTAFVHFGEQFRCATDEFKARIDVLEQEQASAQEQIGELREAQTTAQVRIKELEAVLNDVSVARDSFEERVVALEGALSSGMVATKTTQSRTKELHDAVRPLQDRVHALEGTPGSHAVAQHDIGDEDILNGQHASAEADNDVATPTNTSYHNVMEADEVSHSGRLHTGSTERRVDLEAASKQLLRRFQPVPFPSMPVAHAHPDANVAPASPAQDDEELFIPRTGSPINAPVSSTYILKTQARSEPHRDSRKPSEIAELQHRLGLSAYDSPDPLTSNILSVKPNKRSRATTAADLEMDTAMASIESIDTSPAPAPRKKKKAALKSALRTQVLDKLAPSQYKTSAKSTRFPQTPDLVHYGPLVSDVSGDEDDDSPGVPMPTTNPSGPNVAIPEGRAMRKKQVASDTYDKDTIVASSSQRTAAPLNDRAVATTSRRSKKHTIPQTSDVPISEVDQAIPAAASVGTASQSTAHTDLGMPPPTAPRKKLRVPTMGEFNDEAAFSTASPGTSSSTSARGRERKLSVKGTETPATNEAFEKIMRAK